MTNLIDQLGGYNKAKAHYDKHHGSPLGHNYLGHQLLEYRREHKIYEVGDWIKYPNGKRGLLYQLRESDFPLTFQTQSDIKHATDAEIEAGHCLDELPDSVVQSLKEVS